jgi:Uma2 family endonuclease
VNVELWTNLPEVGPGTVRRLRREEYDALVERGVFEREHVELVRGVIVRMSPQGAPHAGAIVLLNEALVRALAGRAHVRVQLPVIAPDESEPEPDVAVVPLSDPRLAHPSSAHLVVEVGATSQAYDRGTKGPLYAAMGVPELWIVDLAARVIEVHREPSGERYQRVETLRAGATVELVAFPDVRLDVSSFLP